MPEVNYPMRSAAQEPGAKHNIGTVFQNRCKKNGILARIVLQVGILNDDEVPGRFLETRAQCRSLPEIAFLQHEFVDPSGRFRFEEFSCSIGRSVIDNDNFHVFDWCRANCFNRSFNRRSFIITRNNDG